MINDIFKVFGEQTGEILFEIIKDCMDDYLYIFDLQNDTFEISQSAVERFVEKLLLQDEIRYCPHGRPVMVVMSQAELEKQFGRMQ